MGTFSGTFGARRGRTLSQVVEKYGIGAWRSLVAHWHGGPGVSSSNLLAPTNSLFVFDQPPNNRSTNL